MTKKNPNFTILQLKSLIIEIGKIQFKHCLVYRRCPYDTIYDSLGPSHDYLNYDVPTAAVQRGGVKVFP